MRDQRLLAGRVSRPSAWPTADLQRDVARREDIRVTGGRTAGRLPPSTGRCRAPRSGGRSPRRRQVAQMDEVEPVAHRRRARPAARAASAAKSRPRERSPSPAASTRSRRQRIDQFDEAAEDRIGAGARHLLRDDDRGQAGEARLGQPQRHVAGCMRAPRRGADRQRRAHRALRRYRQVVIIRCISNLVPTKAAHSSNRNNRPQPDFRRSR